MKSRNGMRIISVLMTLLLVSAMAMPAMACPCSQDVNFADDSGAKVEATELSGVNRNEAIAQALSDKGILNLRKELIKSGYKPSIEKISAMKFAMANESGTITSTLVAMPFSGKDENETAVISFVYNELGSAAASVVISDGMLTTLGYDSINGEVQILGIDYCSFCMWAVGGICGFIANKSCSAGCLYICKTVPNPAWAVICYGTCWLICDFIVIYNLCGSGADEICTELELC